MTIRRALRYGIGGIIGVALLAAGGVYAASEMRLAHRYDVPVRAFDARAFAFTPAEAERRARSFMCADCHQKAGQVLFEAEGVGRLVTPNLTRVARTYTDGELERLIRKGIKKDGTGAIVMPAKTYAHLSDEDVAAVITWLRSLEQQGDAVREGTRWGPLGRLGLATDKMPFEADELPGVTPSKQRPADTGAYLVRTLCQHCHELRADHDNGFGMKTPALAAISKGYSFDQFETLLSTGKPIGGREMPFMSKTAREAFAFLSHDEKKAIYDYLVTVE
jgi:mono/diheme cytochrome c family protein